MMESYLLAILVSMVLITIINIILNKIKPKIVPKVFIIKSSTSVARMVNNCPTSIISENIKPANTVGINFLNLFHNVGSKNPNGIKNIILSIVEISIPLLSGIKFNTGSNIGTPNITFLSKSLKVGNPTISFNEITRYKIKKYPNK